MHLQFHETMQGRWSPIDAPLDERAITFSLAVQSRAIHRFLRKREAEITGTVDAEGLATGAALRGTLGLDVLRTGTLPYDFRFLGNDGRRYRFMGQKTVLVTRLTDTMTTLPAAILDAEGREIGTSEVRFDLKDLPSFLWSWKLAR